MLPLTFDHHVLSLLPPMDEALEGRVLTVLRAIVKRRVLPWLAASDGVDAVQLARASERHRIARFEDPAGEVELVSFVTAADDRFTVWIHERVFDYIAFGLPANPLQAFEPPTEEAAKVMALSELVLRHQLDVVARPQRPAAEALVADCAFVEDRREHDPGFAGHLEAALADPTNGLRTETIQDLVARHDAGNDIGPVAEEAVAEHLPLLVRLPVELLAGAFEALAGGERERLLASCFRLAADHRLTVARRARHLEGVVALLDRQRRLEPETLGDLFVSLLDAGGRETVLRELEIDTEDLKIDDDTALLAALLERLGARPAATSEGPKADPAHLAPALEGPHLAGEWPKPDSLKERIEAARTDPRVPRSVVRAIDNNASNIGSHSSAKYTEFIETLLAVPWGRLQPIEVGPLEFAAGLDAGHFGLAGPKELVADFFANLIWRYRDFDPERAASWRRTGSAFLFVGPPGVGKTSLAISIASNLGLPYHKISLGGMRDESVLRGHGFTYEGSKPGAIVQGLIKMECMNGLFILDEADKTEPMTVATLLEILDPEQNHLFHDKYTLSTVDVDLSNCHFILTANTLDTVPPPVIDRCQVVHLDRYSLEEKVAIAHRYILPRLRERYSVAADAIDFEQGHEDEHLRYLIRTYTREAGVRQLELALRTLLLRLQRTHLFSGDEARVEITHNLIKRTLESPTAPAKINADDRIGEALALGVNPELGVGGLIPVQATRIGAAGSGDGSAVSMVHATGNLEKVMDESRRVATTAILHCADALGISPERVRDAVHLHFLGASTRKDGPSAGAAIALALASLLTGTPLRRDLAATGEVDTQGRVSGVGGLDAKLETAADAGCRTVLIPVDNLTGPGGIDRLPESLRNELQVLTYDEWSGPHDPFDPERHVLQVVAVDHILQAFEVAKVDEAELAAVEELCRGHARRIAPGRRSRQPLPVALVVKDPEEFSPGGAPPGLCESCGGCRLLVPEGTAERWTQRVDGADEVSRIREVGRGPEGLAAELHRVGDEAGDGGPLAVVAPFFALKEVDVDALGLPGGSLVFVNNFIAQGVKLRSAKPLFNRVVCRLLHFDREALESFPLLVRRDGVWLPDLEAVPEKYRLEPGRCRELLERFLGAWLEVVDSSPMAVGLGTGSAGPGPRPAGAA
ncbi:MAG TPA: S16 family serine protease [Methylomirabilota bacterium]|nr:S16 family serine protease [Methylomirabilota bacterium]